MKQVLSDCYNMNFVTEWNADIDEIFALFKVLSVKGGKSPSVPFPKVIERFIFHSEVSKSFVRALRYISFG